MPTATPSHTDDGSAPDWARVRELFHAALALPIDQRPAWVRAQGGRAAVQDEVLSLLAEAQAADEAPGFLAPVAGAGSADGAIPAEATGPQLPVGTRLGPWAITGPLGQGGMAEVLCARRADGAWEGEAAVKLLRRGMDSAAVLRRFALEQQALARLAHPHIARLLDAGRAPQGQPYFVMEKVEGRPIDRACQGQPLERRLQWFLQLADAVAFAHRHLLVHRDLKPSNVLVDVHGQVKLLDFGIAKALDPVEPSGAEAAGQTQAGQRPFTPHYASPEQVRGEPVGTATDLYSLGVLLYVMLTGQRPYGRGATTPQEAVRSVLEEDPTRPSALGPGTVDDPQWLSTRRRLRGDLDNILLKALEKAPERRYPSVEAMARDVQAYLAQEPVSAHAPSWGYRAGKFVARHRAASLASALAVLALAVGAVLAGWQARVAQAERDLAQARLAQVRQMANQLVFKYHDEIQFLPGATQVRQALLVDAAHFLDSLRASAEADPALARELAETYYRISRLQGVDRTINTGQHGQARRNLEEALRLSALYAFLPDAPLPAVAVALNMRISLAEAQQWEGQVRAALQTLDQAAPLLQAMVRIAPQDSWTLTGAVTLHMVAARVLGTQPGGASAADWAAACGRAQEGRRAADALLVADPVNAYGPDSLAFAVRELGQCRLMTGGLAQAQALFEEELRLRAFMVRRFPQDADFRYQQAAALARLGQTLSLRGEPGRAQAMLDQALAVLEATRRGDAQNAAARRQRDALRLLRARHALAFGQGAAARRELTQWLQEAEVDEAAARRAGGGRPAFALRQAAAEGRLLAAQAWREVDAARALALAQQALPLLSLAPAPVPVSAGDEDPSNRAAWGWQALALGEVALAQARLGAPQAAALAARQALDRLRQAPGGGWVAGPPQAEARWRQALRTLADHGSPAPAQSGVRP